MEYYNFNLRNVGPMQWVGKIMLDAFLKYLTNLSDGSRLPNAHVIFSTFLGSSQQMNAFPSTKAQHSEMGIRVDVP